MLGGEKEKGVDCGTDGRKSAHDAGLSTTLLSPVLQKRIGSQAGVGGRG